MRKELENYLISLSNFKDDYKEWLLENEEKNSDENFYKYVNDYFKDEFHLWQIEKTKELANDKGLIIAQSTQGSNGYPKGLKTIIIGFSSYEEITDFISEIPTFPYAYDMEIMPSSFKKHDGHDLWQNEGTRYKAYCISDFLNKAGDNYHEVNIETELDLFKEQIKGFCDEDFNTDEIQIILDKVDILEDLDDGIDKEKESIVLFEDHYEIIPNKFIAYSHDIYTYKIGIEL